MSSAIPVPVTALYAGLLALLLIVFTLRVIRLRWQLRVGTGDGGDKAMSRAIRVHGNAAEHVPIALILLLVAELNRANPALLHGCGVVLVAARVLHAAGLGRSSGASSPRAAGVAGTIGVIITLAAVDIAAFLRLT
jgi:uncharacterized membrane protein YecN with MAPEG domain